MTIAQEREIITIDRPDRSTYPEEISILTSIATPMKPIHVLLLTLFVLMLSACSTVGDRQYDLAVAIGNGTSAAPFNRYNINADSQATAFMEMAAYNGNPNAQYAIAQRFYKGNALSDSNFRAVVSEMQCMSTSVSSCNTPYTFPADYQSYQEAIGWLKKAVYNGFVPNDATTACALETRIMSRGTDVVVAPATLTETSASNSDIAKQTFRMCTRSALAGNANSQAILGALYDYGVGLPSKNPTSALKWYAAAAALQNPRGMYGEASLYERGDGVPKDMVKAMSLYKEAANLAFMPGMFITAYWAYKNGSASNEETEHTMREVATNTSDTSLSPDQKSQAQYIADQISHEQSVAQTQRSERQKRLRREREEKTQRDYKAQYATATAGTIPIKATGKQTTNLNIEQTMSGLAYLYQKTLDSHRNTRIATINRDFLTSVDGYFSVRVASYYHGQFPVSILINGYQVASVALKVLPFESGLFKKQQRRYSPKILFTMTGDTAAPTLHVAGILFSNGTYIYSSFAVKKDLVNSNLSQSSAQKYSALQQQEEEKRQQISRKYQGDEHLFACAALLQQVSEAKYSVAARILMEDATQAGCGN